MLSGHANDRLLDSYHQERQPIGDKVVSHAIRTLHVFGRVPKVLGFHPGQSPEEGYESVKALFTDAEGQQQRRDELKEVIDLQNLRSNALGMQLGHRYADSEAVVDDGTPFPPLRRDPILCYEPTTHPGGYLPHAWVELQHSRISTLDIIQEGSFGLIVGIGGAPFVAAAETVSQELGLEIPVYAVGYRCQYDDVLGEWTKAREMSDRGALLVRPDRHIAWRCMGRPEDPTEALCGAMRRILARDI